MGSESDEAEHMVRLFRQEVPEIASGLVEIRGVAREVGVLSMVLVHSAEGKVFDTVGAVVGNRGCHLKEIQKQLGLEQLTVVRWSDSVEQLIRNSLRPLEILAVSLNERDHVATVVPGSETEQGPHAEGGEVQASRLRLLSRLTGWQLRLHPG